MTSEQLQATRALRWRQNAEPILTQEDAEVWLQQAGLCLFLPRRAQLPVPGPSFVEACLGETNATPPRAAVESSLQLVARLIEADRAVPLNLFGTPADHPDFLVSPDTLPFVYALRGDRDWKHAPGSGGSNRVSPLVTEVWKLLERKGVLSATEIQDSLGRELTEAAVVRALYELWGSLRVTPLYQNDGEPTLWEPLQSRHQKALNAAINMSQVTALSVLASLYFTSAVAATSADAEIFLSPVSSRSKVREVIRGLTATRQLSLTSLDRETLLFVEGSLPEFEEAASSREAAEAPEGRRVPRRTFVPAAERPTSGSSVRPAREAGKPIFRRPGAAQSGAEGQAPAEPRPPHRGTAGGAGDSAPADTKRADRGAPRRERTPARPPWKDKGKPGFSKSAAARDPKARWPREGGASRPPGTTDAPFPPRKGGAERPATGRPASSGGARPPQRRESGSFQPRRDFKPRGDFKPRSDFKNRGAGTGDARPRDGAPASFRPRPASGSAPRRESGGFKPRGDFKDFKPRRDASTGRFQARASGFSRPARSGNDRLAPARRESAFKPERDFTREGFGDSPRKAAPSKTGGRKTGDSGGPGRATGERKTGGFSPRPLGGRDFRAPRGDARPAARFDGDKPRGDRPPTGSPYRPGGASRPYTRPGGSADRRNSGPGTSASGSSRPGRSRPGSTGPGSSGPGRSGPGGFGRGTGVSRPPVPRSAGSRPPSSGSSSSGRKPFGGDRPTGTGKPQRSGPGSTGTGKPHGKSGGSAGGGFKKRPSFGGRSTPRSPGSHPPRPPSRPPGRPSGGPKRRPE